MLYSAYVQQQAAEQSRLMSEAAGYLNDAAGWQAIERGVGATILGSTHPSASLIQRFEQLGEQGDAELARGLEALEALRQIHTSVALDAAYTTWRQRHTDLLQARERVRAGNVEAQRWLSISTDQINAAFSMRNALFLPRNEQESIRYFNLATRANVATLAEYAGMERANLGNVIASGQPIPVEVYARLQRFRAVVDYAAAGVLALTADPTTSPELRSAIRDFEQLFLNDFEHLRQQIYQASAQETPYPVDSAGWIDQSTTAINSALQISTVIGRLSDEAATGAQRQAARTMTLAIAALLAALIIFGGILFFVRKKVIEPVNQIISMLTAGSSQVHSASDQVSSASQDLANGAAEQAAALEQSSASLEEITSMTRQSTANAQNAAVLTGETRNTVRGGVEAMTDMQRQIQAINKNSEESTRINKTINDIAFQTNLLALNAAVEAARAGEAGKGFAVVAEEVRNLARRSAEAAGSTEELLNDARRMSLEGVRQVETVHHRLTEIDHAVEKVTTLISEIALAANEQSKGLDQVNIAITEMDKVTQQTAANSEETASASEELSAQAQELNQIVRQLALIVNGFEDNIYFSNDHSLRDTSSSSKEKSRSETPRGNGFQNGFSKQQNRSVTERNASEVPPATLSQQARGSRHRQELHLV